MAVNEVLVESPIASAMGAKVSITGPGRGMYLVISRSGSPESLVRAAQGQIVLRLNGRKLLATLPFAGYLALRAHGEISHIGPVTIDVQRFQQVAEMLAKSIGPPSNGIT